MPTITVCCAPLEPKERKHIALSFTRMLKELGSDPAHCMVFFTPLADSSFFSAGIPLPSLDSNGKPSKFFLRATISEERDEFAQKELATGLYDFLKENHSEAFVYIQFDTVDPRQVFYSAEAGLVNAGQSGERDHGRANI